MSGAWKPVRLSPLHHRLLQAGAVMKETCGWLQAEHFGDCGAEARAAQSAVGVFDRSPAHKLELRGKAEFLGAILGGAVAEPGRGAKAEWGYAGRLSPGHAVLIAKDTCSRVPVTLGDEKPGCVHILERTDGYGAFWVCGPAAADVLRKLTSLDLREESFPNLGCAAAPFAAVRAVIVRKDEPRLAGYEVLFSREYGQYLWDALMESGAEFGLRPFGLAAASLLDPP